MPAKLPPGGAAALREQERRRARLIVALAALGIAAMLIAYTVSPSVRHAVGKAAHGVSNVFDHDTHGEHGESKPTPQRPRAKHDDHKSGAPPATTTPSGT
jgi:hypothetical protein